MNGFLPVLMRAVHILSAVVLLGGAFFWRFGVAPAGGANGGGTAAKWRPIAYTTILGLLLSGLYNGYNKFTAGTLPPIYHSIFGIKILLALHVFAVGFLLTKEPNARRVRQLTGVVISGASIVVLSSVLRYVSSR